MTPPLLEAEHVTRLLAGPVPVTLVEEIDLQISAGEFVAITGPSGSGKSSLLYLLGLLDHPTDGTVRLDGQETSQLSQTDLAQLRLQKLGFVFQFHFLLPEFSVIDNVMIPMRKLSKDPASALRPSAFALLKELGLESKADKKPSQLSGGERQRAAIARALANNPLVVLADEPTGNLDQKNGQIVFDIFKRLVNEHGKTVITVTHDTHLSAQTHRRVRLIDGRIVGS